MTILQIRYFIDVYRYKSFSKAAEKNFVSQPAMSNIINSLEKEMETTLFMRDGKKLVSTSDADEFLIHCENFLQHFDFLSSQYVESKKRRQNILRLGIPPMLNALIIEDIYNKVDQQGLDLQITLTEANISKLNTALGCGSVDAVISYQQSFNINSNLTFHKIFHMQTSLCAHTRLALPDKNNLDLKDLDGVPLALYESNSPSNVSYRNLFTKENVHPHIICESSQVKTLEILVNRGIAAAFIPASFLEGNPDIRAYTISEMEKEHDVGIFYKTQNSKLPSIESFVHLF